ncbi:MAG: VWA domain-containing protein [Deltaproteobacteria bacterium]|nr:VWA domain-containing protein [Deltaproteobacteria bacterium]
MLVDCSASMGYRGTRAELDKLSFAEVLLGAMAHVLVRQGDAVGLLSFAGSPAGYLPPKRRPAHLPVLMSQLAALEPAQSGATGFAEAIRTAAERAGRRAMIAVATDLWGAGKETEVALKSLAARGHDVVLFHVLSPDEVDLPFERAATFAGMEGEGEVDVDPALIRDDYRTAVSEVRERWRRTSGEAGIDLVQAVTSSAPHAVLADFAIRRHRAAARVKR